MKVLIVFALIAALADTGFAQDLTCPQLEAQGEEGIRKMFIIEEGAKIPSNEAEVDARCNEGKKLFKVLLEYKKCLKPFPQQVFGTTTQSMSKLLKKNCGDAEGKKQALKLFQCATPEIVKETQKCVVGSLDAVQKIAASAENKKNVVNQMCCLSHVAVECAKEKMKDVKCADPSIKPQEHLEDAFKSLAGDTLELACDDLKTYEACQAKVPEVVAMLKTTMASASDSLKGRELIKPLLLVAEKVAN